MSTNPAPLRILVVDDEAPMRRLLRTSLAAQGYHVLEAKGGHTAIETIRHDPLDVIVLDLGLPDLHGFDVIEIARAEQLTVPIIVLSALNDDAAKVKALDLGADDYVSKPFSMDELLARIRATLRHRLFLSVQPNVFRSADLAVDLVRRIVTVREQDVKLSPREYELLRVLIVHAGKVLTHKFLIKEVWGSPTDAQYLRVYIRALRQKLEANPDQPYHILTEHGVGYRFRVEA